MSAVFADAYYFVGLLNRDDQHRAKCMAAARELDARIVTTEWVLVELADALIAPGSRELVAPFIQDLEEDPEIEIIYSNKRLLERGLRLYHERRDKRWTLTDCISFIVMADEKITEALTGDRHFEQAGFKALLA